MADEDDNKETEEEQKPARRQQAKLQQEQEKVEHEQEQLREAQEQLARDRKTLEDQTQTLERDRELVQQWQKDAETAKETEQQQQKLARPSGPDRRRRQWRGDKRVQEARNILSSAAAGEVADVKAAITDAIKLLDSYSARPRRRGRSPGRPRSTEPNVVALIKHLRFERGMTYAAIADHLNEQGIRTPRGGLTWRSSSFQWLKKEQERRRRPRYRRQDAAEGDGDRAKEVVGAPVR